MLFAGVLILGEFLERRLKEHFDRLKQKQKELGVKLPPFPKPIFTGSTKNIHSMKTKPGSKSGDNVLLIHFYGAKISDYTFESIQCQVQFKFFISTIHFMLLTDITDAIMGLHNAPIHIEEFQNVFTEKGYVKPQVHVLNAKITNVTCMTPIERLYDFDIHRYVMNANFDIKIIWPPTLKL